MDKISSPPSPFTSDEEGPKTYDILVIEDDNDDWKLIKRALSKSKTCVFNAARVSHLRSGITAIRHRKYHAILLDLVLEFDGPSNGIDTVVEIVKEAASTPIIVLSSMSDIEIAVRAVGLGASSFVEKPPTPNRIESAIRQAIKHYTQEDVVRRLMRESLSRYSSKDAPVMAPLIGSHLDNIEAGLKQIRMYVSQISPSALTEFDKIIGYSHVATSTREIRKILHLDSQDDRITMPPASATPTPSSSKKRTITERAIEVVKTNSAGSELQTEADARAYLLDIQSKPPPPGDTDE